jgi:hypothetical protein
LVSGLVPVELGHGDIHHDDIRGQFFGHLDRLATVIGLTHHFKIGLNGKQCPQTLPKYGMIVH